ncbi:MAG: c-type cytochrome [Dyella sp.]
MSFRPVIALALALCVGTTMAQEAKQADPLAPLKASGNVNAGVTAASLKPGDATAGQAKAAVCGACHGADGNSTDPQYPKLAGQSEGYIAHQLASFKSAKRVNPIMIGFAAPLTEQDMLDIGAYYAGKTSRPGVADEALVAAGERLYRQGDSARGVPACMACHSIDGRGNPGALYPQLTGQHATYIEARLKAWQAPTTSPVATVKLMQSIAAKLDAQEIAAVANYIEGLHSVAPAASYPTASAP